MTRSTSNNSNSDSDSDDEDSETRVSFAEKIFAVSGIVTIGVLFWVIATMLAGSIGVTIGTVILGILVLAVIIVIPGIQILTIALAGVIGYWALVAGVFYVFLTVIGIAPALPCT